MQKYNKKFNLQNIILPCYIAFIRYFNYFARGNRLASISFLLESSFKISNNAKQHINYPLHFKRLSNLNQEKSIITFFTHLSKRSS